jgi:hypothetical protein
VITLEIPERTPSVNLFHGYHWSKKLKEKQRWGWLVKMAIMEWTGKPIPVPEDGISRVTIERYGPRILDRDNFIAGTKWLMDALVSQRFLVDDSPAHVSAEYHQFTGKPYRTIVKIWGEQEWQIQQDSTKKPVSSSLPECGKSPTATRNGSGDSSRTALQSVIAIADELL